VILGSVSIKDAQKDDTSVILRAVYLADSGRKVKI
jgi:hypothetical protein